MAALQMVLVNEELKSRPVASSYDDAASPKKDRLPVIGAGRLMKLADFLSIQGFELSELDLRYATGDLVSSVEAYSVTERFAEWVGVASPDRGQIVEGILERYLINSAKFRSTDGTLRISRRGRLEGPPYAVDNFANLVSRAWAS